MPSAASTENCAATSARAGTGEAGSAGGTTSGRSPGFVRSARANFEDPQSCTSRHKRPEHAEVVLGPLLVFQRQRRLYTVEPPTKKGTIAADAGFKGTGRLSGGPLQFSP